MSFVLIKKNRDSRLKYFIFTLFFFFSHSVIAWEDHAMLTKIVLDNWSANSPAVSAYLHQPIKAESLNTFLQQTKSDLPVVLNEIEKFAEQNERAYRPLPSSLVYQPARQDCAENLELCFRKSLRMNLDLPLPLIVYDPEHQYKNQPGFTAMTSSHQLLPDYLSFPLELNNLVHVPINGQVKRADIIATAAMRPDFGFDIFLYENNGTSFGKLYGWGEQPLGNPALTSHSQIMFHMSSLQDSPILFWFKPRAKENYPEYRAYLFMTLSQFAAAKNHPYWAAVFMGWSLHYIQDLTQPFHTRFTYGLDTFTAVRSLISLALKNPIPYQELETLQENRHVLFEELAINMANSPVQNGKYKMILDQALSDMQDDTSNPTCDLHANYLRHLKPPTMDYSELLQATVPSRYVNSPQFHIESMTDFSEIFADEMSPEQRQKLTEGLTLVFREFGNSTRACIMAYSSLNNQNKLP